MPEATELVTVYRSMDETAKEDCEIILDLLKAEGVTACLCDDQTPGIPEGVFAVCVPPAEAARAEEIVRANPLPDEMEEVDDRPGLDYETIYHSEGSPMAEVEAMGIKNVLEANGIAAVIEGNSVMPNLPFGVLVARDQVARAKAVLAEAERGGPAAADAAELESERSGALE